MFHLCAKHHCFAKLRKFRLRAKVAHEMTSICRQWFLPYVPEGWPRFTTFLKVRLECTNVIAEIINDSKADDTINGKQQVVRGIDNVIT